MLEINKSDFKKNFKFIVIGIAILAVFIFLSLIIDPSKSKLDNKKLVFNGSNSISKLVINEIVTSNDGIYSSDDGSVCDFIELYNGESHDINLKNYGISDKEKTIKWVFPETIIKNHEYLIINLCGEKKNGMYAPFKLKSSGGETVALTSSEGKVIDAVETVYLEDGQSMGRDLNGNWYTFSEITPGFENSKVGYDAYFNNLVGEKDSLIITEFLPKNNGNFKVNDKYPGYIELKNTGKETINLSEYSLSNSANSPFKFKLPNVNLSANEVIVFYTSVKDENSENNYIDFKLESGSGNIILSKKGKIVENQSYKNIENGIALVKINGQFIQSSIISPGFDNTNNGVTEFNKTQSVPTGIIINEVMSNNYSYLAQNGGSYYDWIELKNNSNETINLKNYNISTKDSKMFNLPDVEIKPNEYYILIASGDSNLTNSSYIHTNFKISDTESIYLFKDDNIVDSVVISNIPLGYSYGRTGNMFKYMSPTPKQSNNDGTIDISSDAIIGTSSGIYNDVDSVEISLSSPGTIYYTLNGSIPTTSSNVYKSPILLKKTTVLRVMSKEEGKLTSNVVTKSYIINENHTLPVMSVSLNPSDFNSLQSNAWADIEYKANAELYEKGSSFNISCGLKLFGGSTRGLPKKSFTLDFKKKYGSGKLNYQVFNSRDFSSFDQLVLRSGSQDYNTTFLRDILGTSIVDENTSVDVQGYKSVILYINGSYWGIYNIREKVDETFISNHYNVDNSANIMRIDNNVTSGTSASYNSILNYVKNNDMSLTKNYEYIKTKINIENMADYWIAELFVTNNDIINCRFFTHKDIDDGKLHFIFYDLDYAWYNYRNNYYSYILNPSGMQEGYNLDTSLLRNMMKSEEFKKVFLERLSYNLKNTWKKENVLKKLDSIYNSLLPDMERDRKRWGSSLKEWNGEIDKLKNYIEQRTPYLLSHTKTLFNLSDAQMKEYFGD